MKYLKRTRHLAALGFVLAALQKIVTDMLATPKPVADRLKAIIAAGQ